MTLVELPCLSWISLSPIPSIWILLFFSYKLGWTATVIPAVAFAPDAVCLLPFGELQAEQKQVILNFPIYKKLF